MLESLDEEEVRAGGWGVQDPKYQREACIMEREEAAAVLLEEKSQDLVLAAELGKSLLERNGELAGRNKIIAEEYSARIEVRGYWVCT